MKKAVIGILDAALYSALEAQREHITIREALTKYHGQPINKEISLPVGYSLIVENSGVKILAATGRFHPVCLAKECDLFDIALFDLNDAQNNVNAQIAASKIQVLLSKATKLSKAIEQLRSEKHSFVLAADPFITGEFARGENPVLPELLKLANVSEKHLNVIRRN